MEASLFCEVMNVDRIIKENKWRAEDKAAGHSNKPTTQQRREKERNQEIEVQTFDTRVLGGTEKGMEHVKWCEERRERSRDLLLLW
jgi:hypothetical protein